MPRSTTISTDVALPVQAASRWLRNQSSGVHHTVECYHVLFCRNLN